MNELMHEPPELHAVVEVAIGDERLWFELPARPWPAFVRLSGSTPENEVALFVAVASSYGRGHLPAASASLLLEEFPHVLPGGLAVVTRERSVFPSCCCGLEAWPEWEHVLETSGGPWMGHDPSPLVEVVGEEIHVWSDGAMGEKPVDERPIVFRRAQFTSALAQVSRDLQAFLPLLHRWLGLHAPVYAEGLTELFKSRFIRPVANEAR